MSAGAQEQLSVADAAVCRWSCVTAVCVCVCACVDVECALTHADGGITGLRTLLISFFCRVAPPKTHSFVVLPLESSLEFQISSVVFGP